MAETVSRLGCSKNGRDTHTDRRISPLYISEIGQLKIWHHSLFIPPSGALVSHLYITVNSVCLSVCLSVSAIFWADQPWHCFCHFFSSPAVTLYLSFFEQKSRASVLPFFEQNRSSTGVLVFTFFGILADTVRHTCRLHNYVLVEADLIKGVQKFPISFLYCGRRDRSTLWAGIPTL